MPEPRLRRDTEAGSREAEGAEGPAGGAGMRGPVGGGRGDTAGGASTCPRYQKRSTELLS